MFIDPHVHCRDGKQAHKETIEHALKVAEKAGFTAIFDMPNTDPPITEPDLLLQRLEMAKAVRSPVFYGIHMGLTADTEQVKRAVATYFNLKKNRKGNENIIGFKLYAGHSVGNMGVVSVDDQEKVYKTLGNEGYDSVVVVHCEKEDCMSKEWDPKRPRSHAEARPWSAETNSLLDQIGLKRKYNPQSNLHIAHISVPEAVDIVNEEQKKGMNITCGATPHHLILDYTAMDRPEGLLMKMNPPLRNPDMQQKLFSQLRDGKITWIETDHAPHTLDEKLNHPHMSGITGLQKYPRFIALLMQQGFGKEQIHDLTFKNIVKTYDIDLRQRICTPQMGLENEYPYDPYAPFGVLR